MNKIKYYPTMPIEEVIHYASQNALEGPQDEIMKRVVGYYEEWLQEVRADSARSEEVGYYNGVESGYQDGLKDGYDQGIKVGFQTGYDRAIELLTTLRPGKE